MNTLLRYKKTANVVLRDVVERLYQGVLFFQNVTRFHCTAVNVISFTPIRKMFLPPSVMKPTKAQTAVFAALFNRISPHSGNKYGKYG